MAVLPPGGNRAGPCLTTARQVLAEAEPLAGLDHEHGGIERVQLVQPVEPPRPWKATPNRPPSSSLLAFRAPSPRHSNHRARRQPCPRRQARGAARRASPIVLGRGRSASRHRRRDCAPRSARRIMSTVRLGCSKRPNGAGERRDARWTACVSKHAATAVSCRLGRPSTTVSRPAMPAVRKAGRRVCAAQG